MRRILPLILLVLTVFGGVAAADRFRRVERRPDRRPDRNGGVVVRDHRGGAPVVRHERRAVVRAPVYVNNGRYVFHGGVSHTYVRPVIRQRYYNVRVRPSIIVENYDPVPGYIWVTGRWQWNGYEWGWMSGYYAPDTRYRVWYDDGSYE